MGEVRKLFNHRYTQIHSDKTKTDKKDLQNKILFYPFSICVYLCISVAKFLRFLCALRALRKIIFLFHAKIAARAGD